MNDVTTNKPKHSRLLFSVVTLFYVAVAVFGAYAFAAWTVTVPFAIFSVLAMKNHIEIPDEAKAIAMVCFLVIFVLALSFHCLASRYKAQVLLANNNSYTEAIGLKPLFRWFLGILDKLAKWPMSLLTRFKKPSQVNINT